MVEEKHKILIVDDEPQITLHFLLPDVNTMRLQ